MKKIAVLSALSALVLPCVSMATTISTPIKCPSPAVVSNQFKSYLANTKHQKIVALNSNSCSLPYKNEAAINSGIIGCFSTKNYTIGEKDFARNLDVLTFRKFSIASDKWYHAHDTYYGGGNYTVASCHYTVPSQVHGGQVVITLDYAIPADSNFKAEERLAPWVESNKSRSSFCTDNDKCIVTVERKIE